MPLLNGRFLDLHSGGSPVVPMTGEPPGAEPHCIDSPVRSPRTRRENDRSAEKGALR